MPPYLKELNDVVFERLFLNIVVELYGFVVVGNGKDAKVFGVLGGASNMGYESNLLRV